MEVAGQWRRHWAGTAEYGKVTEGGVTTRVARAVEVMQANAPGARVRVMRAAYHQTAGPGAPATSFLMHSSRRVISSGFNLLESPLFPTKPLEISSTPLESSPERNPEENYEVTEPDDTDISEPSKWRSSTAGSVRLPSEESSSADNASIIDLDPRHKNLFRKCSYDSENSEISFPRRSSRVSPLLEPPEDLSTLKYKSLLTGNNDWNNRRKSYSFEDTAPLSETVLHSNDTIAMESSTDSGICKSTELVNDTDDKYVERKERREETFKDWLSKNRGTSSFYKNSQMKPYREHDTVVEDPRENNIALKSEGKLTITVPIKVDDDYEYKKSNVSDDGDRRAKKVEFCKTELHFAADSGKVNIIATDEKPPPANDFRKRRSAFVPIRGKFEEKPITLFGDTTKDFLSTSNSDFSSTSGTSDFDENTAATKSILKNKIPKPKPYLLGENMAFGYNDDNEITKESSSKSESTIPTAVTLINRQLQSQRRYSNDHAGLVRADIEPPCVKKNAYRTTDKGPSVNDASEKNIACEITESHLPETAAEKPVKKTIKILQISPVLGRTRTRQLRENELTYFGVNNTEKVKAERTIKEYRPKIENRYDDEFHSVRLIQKVSNSACNSEADSEEAPEYQNLPLDMNFSPVPSPRTKLDYKPQDLRILQPVIEQNNEENYTTRRSRHRRLEDTSNISRSISEPPKARYKIKEKSPRRYDHYKQSELEKRSPTPRFEEVQDFDKKVHGLDRTKKRTEPQARRRMIQDTEPLYVNLVAQKLQAADTKTESRHQSSQRKKVEVKTENNNNVRKSEIIITDIKPTHEPSPENDKALIMTVRNENKPERIKSKHGSIQDCDKESLRKNQHLVQKNNRLNRTEKLSTPEYSSETIKKKTRDSSSARRKLSYDIIEDKVPELKSEEHRSRSSQRKSNETSRGNEETPELKSEEHRSRSSQRKSNVASRGNEERNGVIRKSKHIDANADSEKVSIQRIRHSSKDQISGRREPSNKSHHSVETNSFDSRRNLSTPRIKDAGSTEKLLNITGPNKTKHNQYVINYDDKNGTVSSVCKVKPNSGADKKKILTNGVKDKVKDRKIKNKSPDRKVLQYPDHQWHPIEMIYAEKKTRKHMHVQRTCQIL